MPFSNPIVAGSTLVRPAIRSPDYVPGVSGWSINRDGTAEFNNINIRGSGNFGPNPGQHIEITSTGRILIYDASNDLVGQIDGTALDLQNLATGSYLRLEPTTTEVRMELGPPDRIGFTYDAGAIFCFSDAGNGDANIQLVSPTVNGGDQAGVLVYGENTTSGTPASIFLIADRIRVVPGEILDSGGFQYPRVQATQFAVNNAAASASFNVAVTFPTSFPTGKIPTVVQNLNIPAGAGIPYKSHIVAGPTISGFTVRIYSVTGVGAAWTGNIDYIAAITG